MRLNGHGAHTPVELKAVNWDYVDGVSSVEMVGGTLRVVLYVSDVEQGKHAQRRVARKLVIPVRAGLELAALVEHALREACARGDEPEPEPLSRHH